MLHNKVVIYDSHQHAQHDALVAYTGIKHLHEFCSYLNRIFTQYFSSSIKGSNLDQIDFIKWAMNAAWLAKHVYKSYGKFVRKGFGSSRDTQE